MKWSLGTQDSLSPTPNPLPTTLYQNHSWAWSIRAGESLASIEGERWTQGKPGNLSKNSRRRSILGAEYSREIWPVDILGPWLRATVLPVLWGVLAEPGRCLNLPGLKYGRMTTYGSNFLLCFILFMVLLILFFLPQEHRVFLVWRDTHLLYRAKKKIYNINVELNSFGKKNMAWVDKW